VEALFAMKIDKRAEGFNFGRQMKVSGIEWGFLRSLMGWSLTLEKG